MDIEDFGSQNLENLDKNVIIPYQPTECNQFLSSKTILDDNQWIILGNNCFTATCSTSKQLASGLYSVYIQKGQIIFEKKKIFVDDLILFPDSMMHSILKEIELFWDKKDVFKEYKFLHRRGYLFYGPHGSGKSCLVQQIIQQIIKKKGVVILYNNGSHSYNNGSHSLINSALTIFRQIEPNRHIACIYEDIDAIINYGEDELLSILDGENQIDDVLNIATTNYPERLDKRIVSRPRRFDRVIKIDMPSKIARKLYFEKKLNIKEKEINKWVEATANFSFASCAELVVSVKCLEINFDEAVNILRELQNKTISSSEFDKKNIGF